MTTLLRVATPQVLTRSTELCEQAANGVAAIRQCAEPFYEDLRLGRKSQQAQERKSRAMRGFLYGGPTRTRTVDQRIMSPLL